MGIEKETMQSQFALGYQWYGEKHVCADCFEDYAIQKFIKETPTSEECDYCGRTNSRPIAAPMDEVLRFIAEGIQCEYSTAEDEALPWDNETKDYYWKTLDSWDLMEEVELSFLNDDLQKDVCNAFFDQKWCQVNFGQLSPADSLRYGWERFCEQIKHNSRYIFFRLEVSSLDEEAVPVSDMLDVLAKVITDQNLITTIPSGTVVYRTRIHDSSETFSTASELGSPPVEKCKISNRMSPAGIPMFYGASDCRTAILETYETTTEEKSAPCGKFTTLRELKALNLTTLPNVPSLFDEDNRYLRPALIFLRHFVDDVSKPIHKDGKEHIEYVPTQAFAEYFRHLYKNADGNSLDGIIYRSSKNLEGINYVLFAENEHCCNKGGEAPSEYGAPVPWLVLESVEVFDPAKIHEENEEFLRTTCRGLLG